MHHKEELGAFRLRLLPVLSGLKLSMSDISLAVRTFLILSHPSSVPHNPAVPRGSSSLASLLALSSWRAFVC